MVTNGNNNEMIKKTVTQWKRRNYRKVDQNGAVLQNYNQYSTKLL